MSDATKLLADAASMTVPFKGNRKKVRYDLRILAAVGRGRKFCRETVEMGDVDFVAVFEFLAPSETHTGAPQDRRERTMMFRRSGLSGTTVPKAVDAAMNGPAIEAVGFVLGFMRELDRMRGRER